MISKEQGYITGEAIHEEDKGVFGHVPGIVVIVNETKDCLPCFGQELGNIKVQVS